MLSDHERQTLVKIQFHLATSDPELARCLTAGEVSPPRGLRYAYLTWFVAATGALLSILSLAIELYTATFLCGTVTLGAVVCQLWWPHPGLGHLRKRKNQ